MMIADIIGIGCMYIVLGLLVNAFGMWELADEDAYVAVGMVLFWPLFIAKYVLMFIGFGLFEILKGIRRNGHKWFVIPRGIYRIFKRTTLTLLGLYQPTHYFDDKDNTILVNAKTGIEVESGRRIEWPS